MKAAQLFIRCLEAEDVAYIFGLPGEENLDILDALSDSAIRFITTRHEQGAAFMANAYGRFTGKPGVCLSTLGPGATNLMTGIADAFLDCSPMVAITGQAEILKYHKESHQYVDIVSAFRPITKWNVRVEKGATIPEIVRKAFRLSSIEKSGPTHIELPEDVAAEDVDGTPIMPLPIHYPQPEQMHIDEAVKAIKDAACPMVLAGNGVIRCGASQALRTFVSRLKICAATSFMGMGAVAADSEFFLSTVGLQARDYISCGFEKADLIIAVGYDPVEFSPKYWNPNKDKRIIHIGSIPAEVDAHYQAIELIGEINTTLRLLTDAIDFGKDPSFYFRLKKAMKTGLNGQISGFPLKPMRIVDELRAALGRNDILISDVGAHKIWIARFFPAYEPNTVVISNGFSAMGIALPAAITAKLLYRQKKVVAAMGDGGFLMALPELETAVRLGLPIVCLIFNDCGYGLISWRQRLIFGREFGTSFGNPDFVRLADSFGAKGYRVTSEDELGPILKDALTKINLCLHEIRP